MTNATQTSPVTGLHHVTAISSNAQGNLDFYAKALGLRFVKRTVNFDDPTAYHLYYGDQLGAAGTIMTFFPWAGIRKGHVGAGQVAVTQFSAPQGALAFWTARLPGKGAKLIAEETVFGEKRAVFTDPEGLIFAVVESADDRAPWVADDIPEDAAIRGFRGVTLAIREEGLTRRLLEEALGYQEVGTADLARGRLVRLKSKRPAAAGGADVVDLHVDPEMAAGLEGAGVVHHVAFSVPDRAAQEVVRQAMLGMGQAVTHQIDRDYFFAIYARTPSGVLFEVATEEPGFTADEPADSLGQSLKLPSQHEPRRAAIEQALPPLKV